MPYFGIFGLEFESNIVMFEISTLEFVCMYIYLASQKHTPTIIKDLQ